MDIGIYWRDLRVAEKHYEIRLCCLPGRLSVPLPLDFSEI
jgi:hypothetical protein